MKNFLNLEQPWDQVKERLKENDVSLTDDDLDFQPGQEDELLRHLSEKMKKSPEEVKKFIESLSANKAKAG
jgi:uncharacterized protein YjbJ (UPF0337 family)